MTLLGIDVSNNNGPISWPDVPPEIVFGLAKAVEGTAFKDPYFGANWAGMKARGLVRGAYDFARPDRTDAATEARTFLGYALGYGLGDYDLLMLDMEMSPAGLVDGLLQRDDDEAEPLVRRALRRQARPGVGQPRTPIFRLPTKAQLASLLDWTLTWLRTVEAAVGFKPLFYSGLWFMQPHNLVGDADLAQYGLVLAAYQATIPPPPPLWPVLAFWQNADDGSIAGINGPCDTDVFNGDLAALRKYGKQPAPQPSPVPVMTNDDYAQVNRLLLGSGQLDPQAASDYLAKFLPH